MKVVHLGLLVLLGTLSLFTAISVVMGHEGKGWLVVPHFDGDLKLETAHFASQWSLARQVNVPSPGGQEI